MPMSPDEIKKELDSRGLTYAKVGKRARPKAISATTIFRNVHQIPSGKSARARRLIASAIERNVEDVFGSAA